TITKGREHANLAALARLGKGVLGRLDPDRLDGATALLPLGSLGNPLPEELILPGARGKTDLSLMLDLAGRLEQQQAAVGVRDAEPATVGVSGQGQVILLGVVAEQGEAEAAFALEGTMAGTGVTAGPAKQAHNMAFKIDLANNLPIR